MRKYVMKNNSLISIILPVYNGGKFLSKAIESCLNQSYKNFELIIVNDCSTDNTLKIAQRYAELDDRIILINNSENKKLPASLNIGHRAASGEYMTWTSDDNLLKPSFIEFLVLSMEAQKVDIVYSDYDIIDNDGLLIRKHSTGPTEYLLYGNKIGASFLYKKEVFHALKGYDENLYLLEDYDFWLRAVLKFKFFNLNENLYQYRLHKKSLTSMIQGNMFVNEQHKKGFILMFTNIANNLGWSESTRNILMSRYIKNENLILKYLLHKEIIEQDILKIENRSLNKEQMIYGLLLMLRYELINNKDNCNFRTLINILKNEKRLLFHKTFSKKNTIKYILNCII